MEKWLGSAIESLGGSVEEAKEEDEHILTQLMNILEKAIQVNCLLVKRTFDTGAKYIKSPTALVSDGKGWVRSFYIEVVAISIALKELIVETSQQILGKIGAQYTQTKNYVRLLLTDLKNPQKAYQMISDRLLEIKRVTVKYYKRGIEVAIDKKHYHDNLNKIVSCVARKIGDVLMNL